MVLAIWKRCRLPSGSSTSTAWKRLPMSIATSHVSAVVCPTAIVVSSLVLDVQTQGCGGHSHLTSISRRYYGSEFINNHLYRYCQAQEIQFTRGRPYKKDDNAHIEQKNWTHVRKLVGYWRYDTPAAVAALNALYRHELRLFHNLFLPSVKLLGKERVGARVRRRYDVPRTPLERVQACPEANLPAVAAFARLRDQLDPFALAQTIDHKIEQLVALATPARAAGVPAPTAASFRPSSRHHRRRARAVRPASRISRLATAYAGPRLGLRG